MRRREMGRFGNRVSKALASAGQLFAHFGVETPFADLVGRVNGTRDTNSDPYGEPVGCRRTSGTSSSWGCAQRRASHVKAGPEPCGFYTGSLGSKDGRVAPKRSHAGGGLVPSYAIGPDCQATSVSWRLGFVSAARSEPIAAIRRDGGTGSAVLNRV